ncbi:hypothetical protein Y900_027935 [Mycolicibacterium aromaticivorans JS19b1 = JCM 16368]|uniref:Uncharacterized protein n=1 Tax=Mycolicibacterium aromaticivorans JS19b1 = JCM 16368 TaxID=1440774 RepID=A0A064C9W9_9MYCO|nr:hypothetical protein Y900_027935 [Mycolicibacterium aromaticivorans JS19b1 = JCM 16368]
MGQVTTSVRKSGGAAKRIDGNHRILALQDLQPFGYARQTGNTNPKTGPADLPTCRRRGT